MAGPNRSRCATTGRAPGRAGPGAGPSPRRLSTTPTSGSSRRRVQRPSDPDTTMVGEGVPLDFPRIQGLDIAGEVAAVGADVDETWVGRASHRRPGRRIRRRLPDPHRRQRGRRRVRPIPPLCRGPTPRRHGVAADRCRLVVPPTAYRTALGMLNRAICETGERVLVTGASGGVGMAAVHLPTRSWL